MADYLNPLRRQPQPSKPAAPTPQRHSDPLTRHTNGMLERRGIDVPTFRESVVGPPQETGPNWGAIFQGPVTQHQTAFNAPGFRSHGASGTMQPTGQPRAIDGPVFPPDNRQLVTPRSPQQVAEDRESANYRMALTYTGQHYPDNPSAFGNRDGSDPGSPRLGRSREDLIRARGQHEAGYDTDRFLALNQARKDEMAQRNALRRQRGIERGDARHQAQLAMLRGDNQMNPMLAMAMQRNPALAVQMMKLQSDAAMRAQELGLQGKGLDMQQEQAAADRLMALAQAEREGRLTDAQVAKIEDSMDPEAERRRFLLGNAPEIIGNNPALARQLGSELMGGTGMAAADGPMLMPDETGAIPPEQIDAAIKQVYMENPDLPTDQFVKKVMDRGVSRGQLMQHMTDNPISSFSSAASNGIAMLRGKIGSLLGDQSAEFAAESQYMPQLKMAEALGMFRDQDRRAAQGAR